MNKRQLIYEQYQDDEMLFADGFDDAIIGVDINSLRVIYSVAECITILMGEDQLSKEDAEDFFYFNVAGSYVGERTPIFSDDWCEYR